MDIDKEMEKQGFIKVDEARLRTTGDAVGITIPKKMIEDIGANIGDIFVVYVKVLKKLVPIGGKDGKD